MRVTETETGPPPQRWPVRKFGTTHAEIHHLEGWLRAQGVSEVVMESTAQYWRPVWYGLEPLLGLHLTHPLKTRARYLRRLLCQIAWAAIHTKDTFFAGLFARLKPRVEGKGAAWAVAHHIARIVWLLLHQQVEYQEKSPTVPNERTLVRKFKRMLKEFRRLGLDVRPLIDQQLPLHA